MSQPPPARPDGPNPDQQFPWSPPAQDHIPGGQFGPADPAANQPTQGLPSQGSQPQPGQPWPAQGGQPAPTQPLPAQGGNPAQGPAAFPPPGQGYPPAGYPQQGAQGGYGPGPWSPSPGQAAGPGAAGPWAGAQQYGPGGPTGPGYPPNSFGSPPPPSSGKRNKTPLLIGGGIVGVVLIGLIGFMLMRPASTTANPSPGTATTAPVVATPGSSVTGLPSAPPTTASPTVEPTWIPEPGECNPILTKAQCAAAKTVGDFYVLVETCLPHKAQAKEHGVVCDVTDVRKIKGADSAKIYIHKSSSSTDLRNDVNKFFTSRGTPLWRVSGDISRVPSKGRWFYLSNRSKTVGAVMFLNYKGKGYMGWTFNSKRVYVEVVATGAKALAVDNWWKRSS